MNHLSHAIDVGAPVGLAEDGIGLLLGLSVRGAFDGLVFALRTNRPSNSRRRGG